MIDKDSIWEWLSFVVCLCLLCSWLSACSIKAEFGYHGKTGRDDTTVTEQFIQTAKGRKY